RSAAPTDADFEHVATLVLMEMLIWMDTDARTPLETRREALKRAERTEARIVSMLAEVEDLLSEQAADIAAAHAHPHDQGERLSLVRKASSLPGGVTIVPAAHVALSLRQTTSMRLVNFLAAIGDAIDLAIGSPSTIGKTW